MFLSRAVIAALFSLTSFVLAEGPSSQSFSGEVTLKVGYRYLLSLPEGYEADTAKKWPLLVFLHGSGERGDNLELLNKHGPPKLIAAGKKFEAIVVSPQVPNKNIWNAHGVKALIDDLAKKHRVDTSRIYLTGISMGGFGTWDTALAYPDTFAAIVPICGGAGSFTETRMARCPWIFPSACTTLFRKPAARPNSPSIPASGTTAGPSPMTIRNCGPGCLRKSAVDHQPNHSLIAAMTSLRWVSLSSP
jgi:poly(3-hydroxybutyrate) depolymerase